MLGHIAHWASLARPPAFIRYNPTPARYARNRVAAGRLKIESPVIDPVRLMDYLVDFSNRYKFQSMRSPGLHVRDGRAACRQWREAK